MTEPIVDEVRRRLAEQRQPHIEYANQEGVSVPVTVRELEVDDLRLIADRHYRIGEQEGHREGEESGFTHGRQMGREQQRDADLLTFKAVLDTLDDRMIESLVGWGGTISEKDRRTRKDLCEEATRQIFNLRAAISVLQVTLAEGGFDE